MSRSLLHRPALGTQEGGFCRFPGFLYAEYCCIEEDICLAIVQLRLMGCTSSKKNKPTKGFSEAPAESNPQPAQPPHSQSAQPPVQPPHSQSTQLTSELGSHSPVSGLEPAVDDPMRAQPRQPVPPPVSENVDVEDTPHALPYQSPQAKTSSNCANGSLPTQSHTAFSFDSKAESHHAGLFPEQKLDQYDPSKSVTLTIRDFEGTFSLSTTLTLNKSTESLYAAVREHPEIRTFDLIYRGKVLPEDSTALGAYGVLESGTVDCLFLSVRA